MKKLPVLLRVVAAAAFVLALVVADHFRPAPAARASAVPPAGWLAKSFPVSANCRCVASAVDPPNAGMLCTIALQGFSFHYPDWSGEYLLTKANATDTWWQTTIMLAGDPDDLGNWYGYSLQIAVQCGAYDQLRAVAIFSYSSTPCCYPPAGGSTWVQFDITDAVPSRYYNPAPTIAAYQGALPGNQSLFGHDAELTYAITSLKFTGTGGTGGGSGN